MFEIFNTDFYDQKKKDLEQVRVDIFQIRFGAIEPQLDYRDWGFTAKEFIECLQKFRELTI